MAYSTITREGSGRGVLARIVDQFRAFWLGEKLSSDPTAGVYFGGSPSHSGIAVNEYTALNYSAYWAGVQLISGAIASLPLLHYKRLPDGGKDRYPNSRVYRLIHDNFSPEHSAMVARETMQAHVLTWGNAYAEIERSQTGEPLALWPLTPDRVRPERNTAGDIVYRVRAADDIYSAGAAGGPDVFVPAADMLHIPGLGFDGLIGYSVVRKAREAIGLGLATEQFGATFFGNGAWPGIVAQHPGKLTKEAHGRLKDSLNEALQGGKPHSLIVTEEGIKVEKMGIPPDDAQFLSTREFQIQEIARWLNLPPHKLRDLTHATFSNIEEQNIEFVVDTLRPWLVRWEQELNRKLIRPLEQTLQFTEHLVDGLLRGASEKRAAYYVSAINWGWMSPNDVRRLENMNPSPDGDIYLVPMNMQPASMVLELAQANLDKLAAPPPAPAPERAEADTTEADDAARRLRQRAAMISAHRALVVEVFGRMVRRETSALRRVAKQGPAALRAWITDFYPEHEATVTAAILPAVRAHVLAAERPEDATELAGLLAAKFIGAHRDRLNALLLTRPANLGTQVDLAADAWEIERPAAMADQLMTEELHHALTA